MDWEGIGFLKIKDKKETTTMTEYVGAIEKQTLENTYSGRYYSRLSTPSLVVCLPAAGRRDW